MRSTIAIILGFLVLFGSAYWVSYRINQSATVIEVQLEQAQRFLLADQWEESEDVLDQTYLIWSETRTWWASFLNHTTLDTIEICYQRLQQYVLTQEKSLAVVEINTLKILLENIPEAETLRLNNIF